jgi:hypothetical protein
MILDVDADVGGGTMTEIFAYCSICNKDNGKETLVKRVVVVNGTMVFELECGHDVVERFRP